MCQRFQKSRMFRANRQTMFRWCQKSHDFPPNRYFLNSPGCRLIPMSPKCRETPQSHSCRMSHANQQVRHCPTFRKSHGFRQTR